MQKKFVTNLAFLLFLNLLIKPFWILGIDRAVQNTVGAASYGLYAALFNFSFLFNILLDVGITNFNNRNIAQHNHLLQKHLSGILVLRIVLSLVYFLFSFLIAYLLGYREKELWMLSVLLINQALISFILYLRSNLAGLHLFRIDSMISILDRFIMIILCGVLLWGGISDSDFRIEWFIWAQTIAYAITAIFTFLILASRVHNLSLKWDPTFFLVILKQSYPFAILILLMTFYNRIDSVMLERLLPDGAQQAGIYAQAYRLLDAANMIAYLFSGLLLPMFAHMIKHRKPIEELAELSFSFIAVPAIMVISCGVFFSQDLMGLLYHAHVRESAAVFMLIINCFLAISSVYIFGTLLTANGNLKQLNFVAMGGMLMNIILNLLLIPRYQAIGAAVSSVLTQFITAGAQILLAHKIFQFHFRWMLCLRYLVFILLSFSLFWFTSQFDTFFIWRAGLAAGATFLLALLLKLIRPFELFRLIKYGED
ncbi:MAG: oligosaccharide flippase family protein [Bacteroidia bacterium]|nr:oligosaccharide flippase family protein [Bacteroidia bacterium]